MKNIFYLLVVLLFIGCTTQPPNKENITTTADKEIIKDLIQGAFDDLWSSYDSTKIRTYHTEDFVILEHGEVWDNAKITSWMQNKLANPNGSKRINKMEYIAINRYGPSIQASYWNYADIIKADSTVLKLRWLESAYAVPTDEGWRIKMMHSTRSPIKSK